METRTAIRSKTPRIRAQIPVAKPWKVHPPHFCNHTADYIIDDGDLASGAVDRQTTGTHTLRTLSMALPFFVIEGREDGLSN
jgi:hypothetical protein